MEKSIKDPLELSCDEAAEIMRLMRENMQAFMEERLLEAHLDKCEGCRSKARKMEPKGE